MSLSKSELVKQLQQMDEYEFENLIADLWETQGWDTAVTSKSSDQGIDVIAEKDGLVQEKMLIQAKRYSSTNKVGSPEIQQYDSLRRQKDNVDGVIIVTTSSFSPQAQKIAKKLNVKLINGNKLADLILNTDSEILSDYNFYAESQSINNSSRRTELKNADESSDKKQKDRGAEIGKIENALSGSQKRLIKRNTQFISDEVIDCYINEFYGVGINSKNNKIKPYQNAVFLITDKQLKILIDEKRILPISITVNKINIKKSVFHSGYFKHRVELHLNNTITAIDVGEIDILHMWVPTSNIDKTRITKPSDIGINKKFKSFLSL